MTKVSQFVKVLCWRRNSHPSNYKMQKSSLLNASILIKRNFQQNTSSCTGLVKDRQSAKKEQAFDIYFPFRQFIPASRTASKQLMCIEVVFSFFAPYCLENARIRFQNLSISGLDVDGKSKYLVLSFNSHNPELLSSTLSLSSTIIISFTTISVITSTPPSGTSLIIFQSKEQINYNVIIITLMKEVKQSNKQLMEALSDQLNQKVQIQGASDQKPQQQMLFTYPHIFSQLQSKPFQYVQQKTKQKTHSFNTEQVVRKSDFNQELLSSQEQRSENQQSDNNQVPSFGRIQSKRSIQQSQQLQHQNNDFIEENSQESQPIDKRKQKKITMSSQHLNSFQNSSQIKYQDDDYFQKDKSISLPFNANIEQNQQKIYTIKSNDNIPLKVQTQIGHYKTNPLTDQQQKNFLQMQHFSRNYPVQSPLPQMIEQDLLGNPIPLKKNSPKQYISQQSISPQSLQEQKYLNQPSLYAQQFFQNFHIKIINYTTDSFLKIQTQIYHIEVKINHERYVVKRRYSDFLQFHECLSAKYVGCILYPFPPKDFHSFVQLKLQHTNRTGKLEAIQKRLKQLQSYLQAACHHCVINQSEELKLFLSSDSLNSQTYTIRRLKEITQQYTVLGTFLKIKNKITQSYSYLKSFIVNEINQEVKKKIAEKQIMFSTPAIIEEYNIIQSTTVALLEKNQQRLNKILQLKMVYTERIQFQILDTDIDLLLQLCGKTSSSKECAKDMEQFVDIELIEKYFVSNLQLKNILYLLNTRQSLIKGLNSEQYQSIANIILKFDVNFKRDWQTFKNNHLESQKLLHSLFQEKWKCYCLKMSKIWK